jgi:hypothetical protein
LRITLRILPTQAHPFRLWVGALSETLLAKRIFRDFITAQVAPCRSDLNFDIADICTAQIGDLDIVIVKPGVVSGGARCNEKTQEQEWY